MSYTKYQAYNANPYNNGPDTETGTGGQVSTPPPSPLHHLNPPNMPILQDANYSILIVQP